MSTSTGIETESLAREHAERAMRHLWPHVVDERWSALLAGEIGVLDSGYGSTVVDTTGRTYIDALAGLMVVNVGHGRIEIGEAMARQAARLGFASTIAANTVSARLADTIASLTPGDLNRISFCSSGSDAVESAIKMAKHAQYIRGFRSRHKIIARRGSYHGATTGPLAINPSAAEAHFGPFAPNISLVPSPNRYRNDFGLEGDDGDLMCASYTEQEILVQGPDNVAAVIAEPISFSNGIHMPSTGYWHELRRICDKYGVFLIADEVVTGYGRTGSMFGIDHFGIVPDFMTMAKGLSSGYAAIAAVAVRDSVFADFEADGNEIQHVMTFGGCVVSAAAALKNIEILETEELAARSATQGELLSELAQSLLYHPTVGDVRSIGLLCGIELVKNRETKEGWGSDHAFRTTVDRGLRARGVIARVRDQVQLAPPLVITEGELERIVRAIDDSLTEAEDAHASEIR